MSEQKAKPQPPARPGSVALMSACALGQVGVVARAIEHNLDVAHQPSSSGDTPLHYASRFGQNRIVELLLAYGADPDTRDRRGRSPLAAMLAQCTKLSIAEMLIGHGCDVNAADDTAATALLLAAELADVDTGWGAHREVADLLVENDAEYCIMSAACLGETIEVDDLLDEDIALARLQSRAHASPDDTTPLHHAVRRGNDRIADRLLDAGADPQAVDANGMTPLGLACDRAIDLPSELLERLMPDDAAGRFFATIALDDARAVDNLLSAAPSLAEARDSLGRTALHVAAHFGRVDIAKRLIVAGTPVDALTTQRRSALQIAVRSRHHTVARMLLDAGAAHTLFEACAVGDLNRMHDAITADPQAANDYASTGESAIEIVVDHVGADHEHILEMVRLLAEHDAPMDIHSACALGLLPVAQHLIERDPSLVNLYAAGRTPLYAAARYGRGNVIRMLLAHGAVVDATGPGCQTAIYPAIRFGHDEAVGALVQGGASLDIESNHPGDTPLRHARQWRRGTIEPILLAAASR